MRAISSSRARARARASSKVLAWSGRASSWKAIEGVRRMPRALPTSERMSPVADFRAAALLRRSLSVP